MHRETRISFTLAARRLGMISGAAVFVFGALYVSVLIFGLRVAASPGAPVGDPWFTFMELLIVCMMPAIIALMAAIHAWAREQEKIMTLLALIFTGILTALTTGLHFSILVLGRTPEFAVEPLRSLLFSFRWPSFAYALDILAWDVFFPLAVISAAPAFSGDRLAVTIRYLLFAAGLLAFAGLSGVLAGNIDLRNIGILGYAVLFPATAALIALLFRRQTATAF